MEAIHNISVRWQIDPRRQIFIVRNLFHHEAGLQVLMKDHELCIAEYPDDLQLVVVQLLTNLEEWLQHHGLASKSVQESSCVAVVVIILLVLSGSA